MMSRLTLNLRSTASTDPTARIDAMTLPLSSRVISTLHFTTQIDLEDIAEDDDDNDENEDGQA